MTARPDGTSELSEALQREINAATKERLEQFVNSSGFLEQVAKVRVLESKLKTACGIVACWTSAEEYLREGSGTEEKECRVIWLERAKERDLNAFRFALERKTPEGLVVCFIVRHEGRIYQFVNEVDPRTKKPRYDEFVLKGP